MNDQELKEYETALAAYEAKDWGSAFMLLSKYADKGHSDAQAMIGTIYQLGLGRPINNDIAAEWYLKASRQGNAIASHNLGTIHVTQGKMDQALVWYSKARQQGFVGLTPSSEPPKGSNP